MEKKEYTFTFSLIQGENFKKSQKAGNTYFNNEFLLFLLRKWLLEKNQYFGSNDKFSRIKVQINEKKLETKRWEVTADITDYSMESKFHNLLNSHPFNEFIYTSEDKSLIKKIKVTVK